MASEDVVGKTSATIANIAEEAKIAASENVKAPSRQTLLGISKSLVAGGVAGGVSRTAVAPLERLKILLQVQNPHAIKYSGTIQGLKYIWRTEGFRGMFKGNGTNCARIVPNSAVKFFSYEEASNIPFLVYITAILLVTEFTFLSMNYEGNSVALPAATGKCNNVLSFVSEDAELTPLLRLGAGACAGIIAMSATYPMDLVRGRITVQTEKSGTQYRGIAHALRTVLREEGPRALYKGWLPSVIGVVPYVGLNFAVYESLKDWLIKSRPFGLVEDTELSVITKLACGAAAGTVGQTVAYPLDVIRRRMQMVGWKHAGSVVKGDGKSAMEYNGMIDAFRKTVRHEGFGALYKGLVPNSVKVVPSIAIAFVSYEVIKDILKVPYVGLNFAVYESLKDWLIKSRPFGLVEDTELSVITKLACGAAAGTVGQTVAYPLDVIRRRMQMVGWKHAGSVVKGDGKSAMEYNGMIDAFRKTVRHEGFGALYKGLVPNSVKVVPSIAIAFVSYEVIKDILKGKEEVKATQYKVVFLNLFRFWMTKR
ncbi:Mitochondrial carrier domain-containing protein [Artemisia annua]|uniref:Mitochondrial carrier domain-containing protein n=1 Tax=Artemisia annua TaxID=35608 RepID=A0A2U1LKV1_ARTAN|nr:Mitochondrial carrier domain-containing protein [Artemisia annua]